jgi:hypothetical protein
VEAGQVGRRGPREVRIRTYLLVVAAILLLSVFVLRAMGRVAWCTCGYVKLWHGVVASSENSQHLTDPYTFSHVLHGFGFYALLWWVARRLPVGARGVIAVALEAAWEAFENTDLVIERYRAATISLDYYGDSIVNSLGDTAATALGFWIAARLPVRATVALTILTELVVGYLIRDNLTLNVVMLIYPFESIKRWQMGG